jgi:hypothetical protein
MRVISNRLVKIVALVSFSSSSWVACGSDGPETTGEMAGSAGSAVAGAAAGGTSGGAGTPRAVAGSGGRAASSVAGSTGGGSGGVGGSRTPGAATGGRAGSAVAGGPAGGTGGADKAAGGTGGSASVDKLDVTTCQPAFETACKPKIEFVNGEPDGRGKVFTNVVPDVETTLKDIACIVCSMLYRDPSEIPTNKRPGTIKLILDTHGGVAQAGGGQIQFDLGYIGGYSDKSEAETKQEMLGVLQHETVHLYQNYGNNGTGEGLADLVRTRKGYYQRNRWRKGGSWKDAYTTSGFFYSWLTGPCAFHQEALPAHDVELPYKLNKALTNKSGDAAYTAVDDLLKQVFNRGADALWQEYQDTAF